MSAPAGSALGRDDPPPRAGAPAGEARPGGEEFFGDAELERVVAGAGASDDLTETVLQAYRAWIGPGPLSKDWA